MINAANVIGLNPKDWQNSAEETRVVAESMQDEQSKQLMLCIAKEYERAAELTQERSKRWRGKSYGIYAAFCTALAAATGHCGVGTSIDVPLLTACRPGLFAASRKEAFHYRAPGSVCNQGAYHDHHQILGRLQI